MKTPFVWLGSGRARKWGVAADTAVLDQVARAGLPVPAGAVLLHELFDVLLAEGVIARSGSDVLVPDPQWLTEVLYRDVRLPPLATAVEVRATAPGLLFPACAAADFTEPQQVAAALGQVWTAQAQEGAARQDVLVTERVAARQEGTAVLDHAAESDTVHLSGNGVVATFDLPHLRAFQRVDAALPDYGQRLQKLLRGLRRTLGEGRWSISWGDDGEICWVTAVASAAAD